MHLVVGFISVLNANLLAGIYRVVRYDFIGRAAVRRCYIAFSAGAGLDDATIEVLQKMGPDGVRLLEADRDRQGERGIAAFILRLLRR